MGPLTSDQLKTEENPCLFTAISYTAWRPEMSLKGRQRPVCIAVGQRRCTNTTMVKAAFNMTEITSLDVTLIVMLQSIWEKKGHPFCSRGQPLPFIHWWSSPDGPAPKPSLTWLCSMMHVSHIDHQWDHLTLASCCPVCGEAPTPGFPRQQWLLCHSLIERITFAQRCHYCNDFILPFITSSVVVHFNTVLPHLYIFHRCCWFCNRVPCSWICQVS